MTHDFYVQILLAFALGHLPLAAGLAALLWAAARRWRADQTAAVLLVAAAGLLLIRTALPRRYLLPYMFDVALRDLRAYLGGDAAGPLLLAAAGLCGLAAVWRGGRR